MGEFVTDGDQPSFLPWDIIDINTTTYLDVQATVTSQTDCQAACAAEPKCQYVVWSNYSVSGANDDQCYLKLATADIAKIAGTDPAAYTNTILFEVKEGQYAVYAAKDATDAANIGGASLSTGTFAAVKIFCDATPACIGMAATTANTWRAFGGLKWEGAVGKVRVVGETINSWISTPTP